MYRKGHVGMALVLYAPLGFVALVGGFAAVALGGATAAVLFAMAPDVDQRIPGVAHRGPTHTVWFALLVGLAGLLLGALVGARRGLLAAVGLGVFGFLTGAAIVLAHLVADALTPAGVRPLEPVDDREYCLDLARAANPVANYALLGAGAVVAAVAYVAGAGLHDALF